jgi:hypothetical protein
MNSLQRIIKYLAIAFAAFLTIVIISGIVSLLSFITSVATGKRLFADNRERIEFSQKFSGVEALNIENSAGELILMTGDDFRVEATYVSKSFIAEVTGNNTLTIKDRRTFIFDWFDSGFEKTNITIYLPEDFVAREASLDTGAGSVTIDGLNARKLIINAGAGNIKASDLTAEDVNIDGGVGNITITDARFKDADINSGVGNLRFEGVLDGDCEVDCGVGKVDFELDAIREDYSFDIDAGIGAVRINGEKISKEYKSRGNTGKTIKIDGGVGDVNIDFLD